jgi:hypothetical protein
MRTLSILLTVVLALALVGCPPSETPTEDVTDAAIENTDEATEAAEANPNAVGAALSEEINPTAVADIASDAQAFADKTVQVQGVPASMCGSGCSMTMEDGEAKLKIRSDPEVFKFPPAWKGQEVLVEGAVSVDPGCDGHHEAKDGEAPEGEAPEGEAAEKEHAHGEGGGFVLMATGARLVAPAATEDAAEAPAEH